MQRLSGKVAIITGAASGFGAAMAHRFAHEGAKVVLADINSKRLHEHASEIGDAALPVQCDISREDDTNRLIASAYDAFGQIDIMINNAGFTHKNMPLDKVSVDNFDLIAAVNMKAIYYSTLAVLPVMEHHGSGVIINIASTSAIRPRKGLTWYSASKGWVISATKSMAVELAEKNIRVNCICPVESDTEISQLLMPDQTAETRKALKKTIPLGRLTKTSDVANAALWLASDEASFVTGSSIEVDGGYSIG